MAWGRRSHWHHPHVMDEAKPREVRCCVCGQVWTLKPEDTLSTTHNERCGPFWKPPVASPVPAELHDADDLPWEQRPNPRLLSQQMQAEFEAWRAWADARPADDVPFDVHLHLAEGHHAVPPVR